MSAEVEDVATRNNCNNGEVISREYFYKTDVKQTFETFDIWQNIWMFWC